jgi:hypothetical protein
MMKSRCQSTVIILMVTAVRTCHKPEMGLFHILITNVSAVTNVLHKVSHELVITS